MGGSGLCGTGTLGWETWRLDWAPDRGAPSCSRAPAVPWYPRPSGVKSARVGVLLRERAATIGRMSTPTTEPTGATPAAGAAGAIPAALPVSTSAAAQAVVDAQGANGAPANPAAPTDPPKASDPAALRADLAGERDKRQAAEAAKKDADDKLAAVLKALGIGGEGAAQQTPEQIAEAARAEAKAAQLELAVVRNAPPAVNAVALLDSRAFAATLGKLDPADGAGITAAILAFVKDKPQYLTGRPGAGTGDAAAAGDPGAGAKSMDDLIRGR